MTIESNDTSGQVAYALEKLEAVHIRLKSDFSLSPSDICHMLEGVEDYLHATRVKLGGAY